MVFIVDINLIHAKEFNKAVVTDMNYKNYKNSTMI